MTTELESEVYCCRARDIFGSSGRVRKRPFNLGNDVVIPQLGQQQRASQLGLIAIRIDESGIGNIGAAHGSATLGVDSTATSFSE